MDFLSETRAALLIDPDRPPSGDTVRTWHDRVGGPRDTNGRRIWTPEICERIKAARTRSKAALGRVGAAASP